ncbi:MAG: HYR domain-containing protein, partial [Candidatus Omnitrophica bacterium]|nr:HYR domain-containing protein [Candidatus Omnitrophota bacterium]
MTTLTVPPSSTPGLRCPPNIVTNCVTDKGTVVFYQVSLCNTNYTVKSDPPSGSLFPPGVTTVTCIVQALTGAIEKCSFTVTVLCGNTNAPSITIARPPTAGNVLLTWPGTGTLQKATDLLGPWITISNAVSPYSISISGTRGFFRLLP